MDLLVNSTQNLSMPGLLIGKVISNYDKEHLGKVKVALQGYKSGFDNTDWIRVATPVAGKNRGFYFLPEVGDHVLVGFINNDIDNPIVIGCLWNQSDEYPKNAVTEKNTVKKLITQKGLQILFDQEDDKEKIQINTPKNLSLTMTDKNITLKDDSGKNIIEIKEGTITIKSEKKLSLESNDIEINAANNLKITGTKIEIAAKNEASIEGKSKAAVSGAQIEIKANATLKVNSAGITEVKGSMVKING